TFQGDRQFVEGKVESGQKRGGAEEQRQGFLARGVSVNMGHLVHYFSDNLRFFFLLLSMNRPAISFQRSGMSKPCARAVTSLRIRPTFNFGWQRTIPRMSSMSWGRWAIAFMMMRSSGVGRGAEKLPIFTCLAFDMAFCSKGRRLCATSTGMPLASCFRSTI